MQALPAHEIEFSAQHGAQKRLRPKFLQRGDAIALKVDGIGRLSNPVQ
jgi:2-keto-4-pentenoate hydratase/2-oxohepta-3-ene-1,7-dioic acid hydratase in catechol pathway